MKLIRYGVTGNEKTGVVIGGRKYDTSAFGEDYDEKFFDNNGLRRLTTFIELSKGSLPIIREDERLGPPIGRPSKIVCVGLNYARHAKETSAQVPSEPIIFLKSSTSIVGPNDSIMLPKNSLKTDWEVELAIVMGSKASYVPKDRAMDYVAGYVLHNDVSERAFQLERGGQWAKGKGCDTFAPLGPWMVTKDEIADPHNLRLWLKLNGKMVQNGNTDDFIFNIPSIISYISEFMTLLPGDVISTGTPHGVGLGFQPPRYLKEGDVLELGIDGLGEARQTVIAYAKG
ncbi:fumarylacetoacetate hydrolase family protein [Pedobacter sp. Du54]|uniref:fumarylacetoacetate hydrolase family protein n=1 Tax=Pedobacter anseongensis TaxID=3133439 RepID=UPI00309C9BA2